MNIDKFLLFDGAMGTYYAEKMRPYNLSQANILDYNTIVSIHREYIDSGAMAITTNTFSITDIKSIELACNAAFDAIRDTDTLIFGSIGPIYNYEISDYYPIINTLIDKGIENFIFETFAEEEQIIELSSYIKDRLQTSFIIASFAVDQNGFTSQGKNYKDIIDRVRKVSVIDSYGLNCVCGPVHMRDLAKSIQSNDIVSIMPNAGYPSYIDNKPTYTDNPEYFAKRLFEIYENGARIIGGCCGTTPRHIKALRSLLENSFVSPKKDIKTKAKQKYQVTSNAFSDKLEEGSKVIVVEYDPPLNAKGEEISSVGVMLEELGADAISIADNPLGRARADSLLIASRLSRDTKSISIIPHITCRDRNAISIRSALMGLVIEGISNILCITGDPVPSCNTRQAKGVYSFNSVSLLSYVNSINKEFDNINFFTGAALNVNANHYHLEIERALKKVKSGAKFFITQPCFTKQSIENTMLAKEMLKVPIICGIMPIKSYRNAVFVNSEISGINIPIEIVESYKDKTPYECKDISIKISLDIIKSLNSYVNGFHIITPPKGEEIVADIIKEIKLL